MNFAFLVHPLGNETDRVLGYIREVDLPKSFGWDMASFFHDLHVAVARAEEPPSADLEQVRVIDELSGLVSRLGARTDGRLYEIPMDSFAILAEPDRALEHMLEAVNDAADWGARIVGLGAMTGIVGGQGRYLAERSPIAVTTGNSLTVYAAVTNLMHACRDVEIDLAEEDIAVVGIPGSIATAAARLLRPRCRSLLLVARSLSTRATSLASELDAELIVDIPDALARARVVLSATSSGGCIDQRWLLPGTIVSDVAVPTDIIGSHAFRDDCLILSGGLAKVPDTMPLSSRYLWFHRGSIAACLAETVVLALDETAECLSLGRNLDPARIDEIGRRAEAHGFSFSRLFSFGSPLADSALTGYRKALARPSGAGRQYRRMLTRDAHPSAEQLGSQATERFRRHINPAMLSIASGLIKPFVKGQGSRVWDAEGKTYLDFVAGFGSLNLGHNHPDVVAAVQTALAGSPPGFSPAAINPYAAALAEQLATIAPEGLEMTFFANSGTEAVEAALKLARRATGRRGLLYCERSFHGKTLGSLSVTGNPTYQRPFEPLIPECEAVPFGDLDALQRALASHRFAAFIVEPIQAEGGIVVPPADYLPAAQTLCRKAGTLLIVDEVQTGLGRTGSLFGVDRLGVEPDLMTLAKSLGGGLVPIGAMLARRDLWSKAYGTLESFALHTSTFGGGSLACAAGLAAVRVLRETDVVANAEERGRQLLDGLRQLASRYPIIREVRGQGLLIGVEFNPPPESIITLLQGLLAGGASIYLVPGIEGIQRSLTATFVMSMLLQEHGIYTQVARSNPRVLRVEPPLILSAEEASQFLQALDQCCSEIDSLFTTFDQMIAKAILGQHGSEMKPHAAETAGYAMSASGASGPTGLSPEHGSRNVE
ncbi:MAG: aminotransferase class III-fold pyridoxal phosphate-dependent enzyme [Thermoguttaceae bacterium]